MSDELSVVSFVGDGFGCATRRLRFAVGRVLDVERVDVGRSLRSTTELRCVTHRELRGLALHVELCFLSSFCIVFLHNYIHVMLFAFRSLLRNFSGFWPKIGFVLVFAFL